MTFSSKQNSIPVTVIINIFNGSQTLSRAIDSILDQDILPVRIIIWDNQSTDDIAAVVSDYPDVDYYLAPSHTSLGEARKLARQLVDTQWFCYLDADDYWYSSKLREQAPFLNAQVGLIYSSVEERTSSGKLIRTIKSPYSSGYQIDRLLNRWEISLVTALINNDILNMHSLDFDSSFFASEEQDLITQLSCYSPFVSIPKVHGVITVTNGSLTDRSLKVLGPERRRTLGKIKNSTPFAFSDVLYTQSFSKSYYYDCMYLMHSMDFVLARRHLKSLALISPSKYLLLYLISFSPSLWFLVHNRPLKSIFISYLDFLFR